MCRTLSVLCVLTALLQLSSSPARAADPPCVKGAGGNGAACCGTNDTSCCGEDAKLQRAWWGKSRALTAIGRLPAERIVVFDPVSNSFAFVLPCNTPGDCTADDRTFSNLQYLDRHRLALPVQKIRLLIMPYNPYDGDLTLDVTAGKGVEFAELASAPTAAPAAAAAATATPAKEPSTSPRSSSTGGKKAATAALVPKHTTAPAAAPKDPNVEIAKAVDANVMVYESKILGVLGVRSRLGELHGKADCAHDHLDVIALEVSRAFAARSFSLARDRSLVSIIREACERSKIVADTAYKSCFDAKNTLGDDVEKLKAISPDVSTGIEELSSLIEDRSSNLDKLVGVPAPSTYSPDDWKTWLRAQQKELADDRTEVGALQTEQKEVKQAIDKLLTDSAALDQALSSPARQIQRFEYPPLDNGESKTFTIKRGKTVKADGTRTAVPSRINSLEIRSAPAYTVRFGTGVVVSALRNPTFKVADESGVAGSMQPAGGKTILFDDRGNAEVLPALFVHHYWGRRSGLLTPTWFERLAPTFSLGIPLAKSDILQQVLFGLDWELVPGVELNAGVHWAKVNTLANNFSPGSFLPMGLDLSSVEQTRFRSAFYAGIVINGETFKSLTGGQK